MEGGSGVPGTEAELAAAAAAVGEAAAVAPTTTSPVVRLRGLPFVATEAEIRAFFGPLEGSVQQLVVAKRAGRSTGEAYVQLDSAESAAQAISTLHRKTMGPRYIEVFESSEADLVTAKSLSVDRMRGFVVRCRGLPYTATATDVLNFFGEATPVVRGVEGVVFTYSPDGRPTGECYVEFQSEEAQREALKKHKETLGSRYIELFVSTKVDMFQAIQQNRLVLGYSSRRRWMQQQGMGPMGPGGPMGGHHPHPPHMGGPHQRPHYGMPPHPGPYPAGSGGPQPHGVQHAPRRQHMHQYGQQVDEVTDMMAGFSVGGQPTQVLVQGGQYAPGPGTAQQQQQQTQRYAYGGRAGGTAGRGGRGMAMGYQGRGGPTAGVMGRGIPQVRQMVAMQPRQATQMVPVGGPGQAVLVQEVPQQSVGAAQYIIQHHAQPHQGGMQYAEQQQQQQWGGQHMIHVQQGPGPQGGQAIYTTTQQQQGIQGMAPGTYTLTAIQMPASSSGNTGGYEYNQQAVDISQNMGATLQIEVPVSALGAGGEMLLQGARGGRYDGQGGMVSSTGM